MYCIEPEELLINIYNNRIIYEPYDQNVCKLFNFLFLNRTEGIIKKLGYMEPVSIIPYQHNSDCITYHDVDLFWQEKDYPYILYCKYVGGWYAYLHLVGTKSEDIDYKFIDGALTLHDMYKNIHVYDYKQWNNYVFNNNKLQSNLKVLDKRQILYYPQYRLYNKINISTSGLISCISRDELYSLIVEHLPMFLVPYLNDTCFVAGGFLAKLSKGIIPTDGDIDIWIVRGQNNGYDHLNRLLDDIEKNGYVVSNNGYTFTCSKQGCLPIQIIPSNYRSLMSIIDEFDTSCTAIAYNGKEIFASCNYKIYIEFGQSYCIRDNILRSRYDKYVGRGYEIVLPHNCTIIEDQVPKPEFKPIEDFRTTCFDVNLFGRDNVEFLVPETKYQDAFMTRKYIKIDVSPELVALCNELSKGRYIPNNYIKEDTYNIIIENYKGYSTIDYYIEYGSYQSLHLTEGIDNDLGVSLIYL